MFSGESRTVPGKIQTHKSISKKKKVSGLEVEGMNCRNESPHSLLYWLRKVGVDLKGERNTCGKWGEGWELKHPNSRQT